MKIFRIVFAFFFLCYLLPTTPAAAQQDSPPDSDAFRPPAHQQTNATRESVTPDRYQPSAFFAGRVAVQIVFVESDGSAEPSTEDWTAAQTDAVTAQVQAALNWWQTQLPDARLSFDLTTQVVPTAYEPITHGLAYEHLWIGDALRHMGYAGTDYFEQGYAADDALRHARGTDWATTIFVANSAADPDGRFTDQLFAYSYINGPFMILTSDVGPYGTNQMAAVVTHEIGHIFGALDQYASAAVSCTDRSGYLDVPNTNSQYKDCGTHLPSLMLDALSGYQNKAIDASALGQVGYRDSDGDHLPDPLDTTPELQVTLSQADGVRPVVSGQADDTPFPSPRQTPITINTIQRVEYRVNDGEWLPLPAEDGRYDSASEPISATLPLYDGQYTVELRAVNSVGTASAVVQQTVTVSGVGADPGYAVSAPHISNQTAVTLNLHAPATDTVQISEDAAFTGAAWMPVQTTMSWQITGEGVHTLYIRFRSAAGLESPVYATAIMLDMQPPAGAISIRAGAPPLLQLDASDDESGVAAFQLTLDDGSAGDWQPFQPTVALPDRTRSVQVRLQDSAGNVSQPLYAQQAQQAQHTVFLPLALGR